MTQHSASRNLPQKNNLGADRRRVVGTDVAPVLEIASQLFFYFCWSAAFLLAKGEVILKKQMAHRHPCHLPVSTPAHMHSGGPTAGARGHG